ACFYYLASDAAIHLCAGQCYLHSWRCVFWHCFWGGIFACRSDACKYQFLYIVYADATTFRKNIKTQNQMAGKRGSLFCWPNGDIALDPRDTVSSYISLFDGSNVKLQRVYKSFTYCQCTTCNCLYTVWK